VVQMVFSSALVRCAGIPLMVQVSMRITPSGSHNVSNPHLVGHVTLGDILEILPFDDPIVVLELDGEAIWAALESSLETWPSQEG
jgi:2',3'-cyclic-nucleotide 2'-phosphodiesterase (5'-nucleotidase family)